MNVNITQSGSYGTILQAVQDALETGIPGVLLAGTSLTYPPFENLSLAAVPFQDAQLGAESAALGRQAEMASRIYQAAQFELPNVPLAYGQLDSILSATDPVTNGPVFNDPQANAGIRAANGSFQTTLAKSRLLDALARYVRGIQQAADDALAAARQRLSVDSARRVREAEARLAGRSPATAVPLTPRSFVPGTLAPPQALLFPLPAGTIGQQLTPFTRRAPSIVQQQQQQQAPPPLSVFVRPTATTTATLQPPLSVLPRRRPFGETLRQTPAPVVAASLPPLLTRRVVTRARPPVGRTPLSPYALAIQPAFPTTEEEEEEEEPITRRRRIAPASQSPVGTPLASAYELGVGPIGARASPAATTSLSLAGALANAASEMPLLAAAATAPELALAALAGGLAEALSAPGSPLASLLPTSAPPPEGEEEEEEEGTETGAVNDHLRVINPVKFRQDITPDTILREAARARSESSAYRNGTVASYSGSEQADALDARADYLENWYRSAMQRRGGRGADEPVDAHYWYRVIDEDAAQAGPLGNAALGHPEDSVLNATHGPFKSESEADDDAAAHQVADGTAGGVSDAALAWAAALEPSLPLAPDGSTLSVDTVVFRVTFTVPRGSAAGEGNGALWEQQQRQLPEYLRTNMDTAGEFWATAVIGRPAYAVLGNDAAALAVLGWDAALEGGATRIDARIMVCTGQPSAASPFVQSSEQGPCAVVAVYRTPTEADAAAVADALHSVGTPGWNEPILMLDERVDENQLVRVDAAIEQATERYYPEAAVDRTGAATNDEPYVLTFTVPTDTLTDEEITRLQALIRAAYGIATLEGVPIDASQTTIVLGPTGEAHTVITPAELVASS